MIMLTKSGHSTYDMSMMIAMPSQDAETHKVSYPEASYGKLNLKIQQNMPTSCIFLTFTEKMAIFISW